MKKEGLVYLFFAAITLIFFAPFLDGGNIFGFRDLSLYFYPLRQLMVEMVKSGTLPLWNPYIFCGIPFFATLQAGFLYPMSLLFYILPFDLGFNWFIILHYFMAASFTYMLMRHYGTGREGAALSGLVFAFSGYLLSVSNMNTSLTSVIWLPLVLLFWDRFIEGIVMDKREKEGGGGNNRITSNPPHSFISLIILLVLMFLGGEPTIFYSTFMILVFYSFFKGKISSILYLPLLLLLVGGVTAVQLVPFIEYTLNSVRTWRTEYGFITHSSFPIRETVNFVFPNLFGNFLTGTYAKAILGKDLQTWILSPYIGIFPVFLAAIALFRRSRDAYLYFFAAIFFLLLAFGGYTPFYKMFFYSVPYLSAIRYPVKFLFFPAFAAAVMAGWGLEELKNKISLSNVILWGMLTAAFSSLCAALALYGRQIHGSISQALHLSQYDNLILFRIMAVDLKSFACIAIFMAVALILFVLYFRRKVSYRYFAFGIIVLAAADLYAFNGGLNPPITSGLKEYIPINAQKIIEDRDLCRFFVDYRISERSSTMFSDQNDILFALKSKLSPNMMVLHRMYDWHGRESIEPIGNARLYWAYREDVLSTHPDILSYSNVKYVLSLNKLKVPGFELINGSDGFLYLNRNARPRAFLDNGSCSIVKYSPNEVIISAEALVPTRLVLADNYYPGWRALVDGKENEIKRAYYLFRGVDIKKGKHEIRFVYDPLSVKIGAGISMMSVLALCLWWVKSK